MELIPRGRIGGGLLEREYNQEPIFDILKDRARAFSEGASKRHDNIRHLANTAWERALIKLPEELRLPYISAREQGIIRFFIKMYFNNGDHLEISSNHEVLGVGFYVDAKDQPYPGIQDLKEPLAFYYGTKWEPQQGYDELVPEALKFLHLTKEHHDFMMSEYFLELEKNNLTEEERAELAEIENSVDNYLY